LKDLATPTVGAASDPVHLALPKGRMQENVLRLLAETLPA